VNFLIKASGHKTSRFFQSESEALAWLRTRNASAPQVP
jgi:hypothetical protein